MSAIDTQLSTLETVLSPMREEALKELRDSDARGWNEKGITSEKLEEMIFQFALDNLEKLSLLNEIHLRMGGWAIALHVLHGDELKDGWDVSALSL